VNEAGRRLFPIQELSSVGRPVWELVRSPQLAQWVAQALSQSEPVGGELELKAPVARILSVRVAGLPGPASAGAVVVASDISQLRRLEQVRQEFVANASHELKTPLASIKACIETLLDGALEDAEIRVKFLQTVNEQTERLDKLVRDLLALTRIESQERRPLLHPVALADIVDLCVNRHRQYAERKEMRLLTVPPPEPVQVLADEEALEQILDNLIDNAIKYSGEDRRLLISARRDGRHVIIRFADHGIGIPDGDAPHVFNRFYRAQNASVVGSGLGLTIVRSIVRRHGGAVTLRSKVDVGTDVEIRMKVAQPV
jgi:two-component system phosphate regulon sensor histidine kinase PhoR